MIKVDILESDVFYGISPIDVGKYLSVNNWVQRKLLPNDVAIWSKRKEGDGLYRLWLPLDNELVDFAESMKKAITVIAQDEGRSQLELIEDFNTIAIGDIIRLNSFDEFNHASSSVLLSHGKALINQSEDLIAAAAMSENQAREVHPSRKANIVYDYLKSVRLGQTEPGSFTVKLVSPIDDIIEDEDPVLPETPPKLPFSRRAVMRLMTGLEAVQDVVRDVHRRRRFDLKPFLEVVPQGLSANLCEAIAGEESRTPQNEYRPVDVSITWSYSLPSSGQSKPFNINFPVEYMGYIARAATEIREQYPLPQHILII